MSANGANTGERAVAGARPLFLGLLAGFVLWSAAFVVLYAVQATGCRLGWQHVGLAGVSMLRILLVVLFAGFVAGHALLYVRLRGAQSRTVDRDAGIGSGGAAGDLAAAALAAAVFCFSGVFWLSAC